jgi:hypothetical protein
MQLIVDTVERGLFRAPNTFPLKQPMVLAKEEAAYVIVGVDATWKKITFYPCRESNHMPGSRSQLRSCRTDRIVYVSKISLAVSLNVSVILLQSKCTGDGNVLNKTYQ